MVINREDHCPVCGMDVSDDKYTLEYLKVIYHFCSEQCVETFNMRPALYSGTLAKTNGKVIKRRKLRLIKPLNAEKARTVMDYLNKLMGVEEIHLEGRILILHYDLLQLTLRQVESSLNKIETQLDNGWLQRIQRAWIHNTEENELDNLAMPQGACCNRPPPRIK
jgi:YHS domain-containing protein